MGLLSEFCHQYSTFSDILTGGKIYVLPDDAQKAGLQFAGLPASFNKAGMGPDEKEKLALQRNGLCNMLWMRPDGSDSALFPGARMETSGIVYTKKHSMQKDRREQTAGHRRQGVDSRIRPAGTED